MLHHDQEPDNLTALQQLRVRQKRRTSRRNHARRRMPAWLRRMVLVVGGLLTTLAVIVVGGLIMLDRTYSGRIFPNVSVQGVPLDRLTPAEARAALQSRYAPFLTHPVTFLFEGQAWTPTPAELGITLDLDSTIERAYAAGRSSDPMANIHVVRTIWERGYDLPVRVTVDERTLMAYLARLAHDLEIAPQNAGVTIVRDQVLATRSLPGRQLLLDETAVELVSRLTQLTPQTLSIRSRLLPPQIADTDVAEARAELTRLLSGPVTLTAGDQRWIWAAEDLGTLVRLSHAEEVTNRQRLRFDLNPEALATKLAELAPAIAKEPIEPRVRFADGELRIVQPGSDGARLDIAQAVELIVATLQRNERTIALPVMVIQPQLRPDTLIDLGIGELVAQGQSSFEGSAPYRITNIQAGAQKMDGVLIPPDAEVSFNTLVGAIDETNGFTRGYAIIDGRTQLEWGGGVCQVSTTVFRAAFWAGLPITERNQHSFRIRWYEVFEPIGMDAAIFTGPGGYDLRFVNDTGRWLLMQTEVDIERAVLRVNLFGTKPNREVIQTPVEVTNETAVPTQPRYIEDPDLPPGTVKQTDTARGGMDVRVGRTVRTSDGIERRDTFFSRFQPWPDIFTYAPGMQIPPP